MQRLKSYISLARPDNWTKNLLMFAGTVLAYLLTGDTASVAWHSVILAIIALCLASSANYTMNETVDARFDRYHPIKKKRASVEHALSMKLVCAQYLLLAVSSLIIAAYVQTPLLLIIALYLFCAWLYNIPPVRLKDVAYADILLESFNYPLRLLMGWFCVLPDSLPPSSVLILGWSIGGFVMTVKRLAEFQLFASPMQAAEYRKSYAYYSVKKLTGISMFFAMLSAFAIAVFLVKYRPEFILAFPFISAWFVLYFSLGMQASLFTVYPERLLKQKKLLMFSLAILALLVWLSQTDYPALHKLSEPLYFHQ